MFYNIRSSHQYKASYFVLYFVFIFVVVCLFVWEKGGGNSITLSMSVGVSGQLLFNAKWGISHLYHGEIKLHCDETLIMKSVCKIDGHAYLDFYSASSLEQQSAGKHVSPLGHIILIPNQSVFILTPKCCVFCGETTNTLT